MLRVRRDVVVLWERGGEAKGRPLLVVLCGRVKARQPAKTQSIETRTAIAMPPQHRLLAWAATNK